MRTAGNPPGDDALARVLAYEQSAFDECVRRLQPFRETVRGMGLALRCELQRYRLQGPHLLIPDAPQARGQLPPRYCSRISITVCRGDEPLCKPSTDDTFDLFAVTCPLVEGEPGTLAFREHPLDRQTSLEQQVGEQLRGAGLFLQEEPRLRAQRQTKAARRFEMPVDDLLSTADGFGDLPLGVLVTGIAEWGHVRPGDTVRFLDSGGGERALAVVHSVYAQDDILAGRPKALRVSPVGEVALLFTGQDLLETLVPGEHTAVI